ncbi:MAG: hypothetical protein IKL23_06385, partial [Oscillospiraceae bacterium]|nr:hypothetical protein [Oscillospiraceae bacterium]
GLGIALMLTCAFGNLDSYWSGMGSALIVVGTIFLFRQIKYKRNPAYKEQVDTANNDERNKYLGMKAWAWTGYSLVILLAVGSIGCRIAEQALISTLLGGIVCLMVVLYWLFYLCLSKKY